MSNTIFIVALRATPFAMIIAYMILVVLTPEVFSLKTQVSSKIVCTPEYIPQNDTYSSPAFGLLSQ